jgi:hypothetical protein
MSGKYYRAISIPCPYDVLVLTGVPHPVTASQPTFAGKPVVLHPAEEPLVTSGKISTEKLKKIHSRSIPVNALWP